MKILELFTGKKKDTQTKGLNRPISSNRGGWRGVIRESFSGAWQNNVEISQDTVLSYHAVYACLSLISSDISKLPFKLVKKQQNGRWVEYYDAQITKLLKNPNPFQNGIKFRESWVLSKLSNGNAYVYKARDNRGKIAALYVLDPTRVTPLISESGDVFYEIKRDDLAGISKGTITVPASEIIHDRGACLYHPLVGTSPLLACGLSAMQGYNIQSSSAIFFQNSSQPGGILTAPGSISDETAARLKETFENSFSGSTNAGRLAVVGDGLEYKPMSMTALESDLINQLKLTAEIVASCFHVPLYMLGIGTLPSFNNIEALQQQYYTQCLQVLIESIEACLDDGLELAENTGTELDLKSLLRMDTAARYKAHSDAIGGGWMKPDEARLQEDLEPVEGGDAVYLQQQNYSLAALAKRDAGDPLSVKPVAAPEPSAPTDPVDQEISDEDAQKLFDILTKSMNDILGE